MGMISKEYLHITIIQGAVETQFCAVYSRPSPLGLHTFFGNSLLSQSLLYSFLVCLETELIL
jgi:hypothetical protein